MMIGSESVPPKTASAGAFVVSTVGSLVSSIKLASVTEAQANDKEAIASRAKRDLKDFMMYILFTDYWLMTRVCENPFVTIFKLFASKF